VYWFVVNVTLITFAILSKTHSCTPKYHWLPNTSSIWLFDVYCWQLA